MILVTGGAGYIGSHCVKELVKCGYDVVVFDNLSEGYQDAVKKLPLEIGDIGNTNDISSVFEKYNIEAVMHFAANAYVGESVINPLKYYMNNVANGLNLLKVMIEFGIKKIVFSSTCATYGEPINIPITEEHVQNPINPYGFSKYVFERILDDFDKAYGLKSVKLRYFNAAGADPEGKIGEDHRPETHLIPLILEVARGKRENIEVYGNDYPTKDGTCIRDYIHVTDLVQAHILALKELSMSNKSEVYNLGNGQGYSVLEVIEAARRIAHHKIPVVFKERRLGDPAILVGSSIKAKNELNWNPKYVSIEEIISTAWKWHLNNPNGYAR